MNIERRKTRRITVGEVEVGGGAPVSVQSMLKTAPMDFTGALRQARALERAGCEIIRLAVPDAKSARVIELLKSKLHAPLVADIHYSKRLALLCLELGADCVRINPGNIGTAADWREITGAAKRAGKPLRIGVNSGSLPADLLKKHGGPAPAALVECALRFAESAEKRRFRDFKVSLKAADPAAAIDAYRSFSAQCDAPLHIGITEAGGELSGCIRSAAGLGVLLAEGIGDTMRVSLTAPPVAEVRAAWQILSALDIRRRGVTIIACPMCARATHDITPIVRQLERRTRDIAAPLRIAVMACPVNGPGEAREADFGAALGGGKALIFEKGSVIKKVGEGAALQELLALLNRMEREANK
jgi:(E)-4-hydroxy-3-methylbut-2-enyl-diphosphate synthase